VVFSATGTPINSSVLLGGKLPTLPAGVFSSVKSGQDDNFTWQPQGGLRVAAVLSKFAGPQPGYVLAGRSIAQIEIRENNLNKITAVAALAALVLSYLVMLYSVNALKPKTAVVEQDKQTEKDKVA
jgi:hypothetical protein